MPIKDDVVDCRIADYVNNYPDRNKLKIMFVRESQGIYEFGTKRIEIRVAQNKIMIRVGGGYISIDEFLDQYTPTELEKQERKDPLKKYSEKLVLKNTVVNKSRDVANSRDFNANNSGVNAQMLPPAGLSSGSKAVGNATTNSVVGSGSATMAAVAGGAGESASHLPTAAAVVNRGEHGSSPFSKT